MNDSTIKILQMHRALYPDMEAEACIKLLCQGALGGGHFTADEEVFRQGLAFYLPVFTAIDRALAQRSHVLVGIDGMCASGKSTLGGLLAAVYRCGTVQADDFFLQPHQRTPARLAEPGGNLDYDRLAPVAAQAGQGHAFAYQAYNCQTRRMGALRAIPAARLTLLEGTYCLHPKIAAPCDVRIFLSVDARVQLARIQSRSGAALAAQFKEEWIPLETRYFATYNVCAGCDIVLDTTSL